MTEGLYGVLSNRIYSVPYSLISEAVCFAVASEPACDDLLLRRQSIKKKKKMYSFGLQGVTVKTCVLHLLRTSCGNAT